MDVTSFLIIFGVCLACMLACRCLPIFLLKGKQLPERFVRALNFIPPAAFAALVTNDLFDPAKVASGDIALWGMPLLAAPDPETGGAAVRHAFVGCRCGARGGCEDEIDGGLHRSGCWHARCAHVCACAVVGFCPCCFSASLI